MMKKYGVVYTPHRLADFVAGLLYEEMLGDKYNIKNVLDPACGECALLDAINKYCKDDVLYYGIDIDKDAIVKGDGKYEIIHNDAILPLNVRKTTTLYWKKRLPEISAVIANPPWSTEKIYEKNKLKKAGFSLVNGQYDSYVLFIELAWNILQEGGYMAFIIPDSLFDAQNEELREFLVKKCEIRVIARLGEKIFEEVNRATTVIICRKRKPNEISATKCFRLSTGERKEFLGKKKELIDSYKEKSHIVLQKRFIENEAYNFDIDTYADEEDLLKKIKVGTDSWQDEFWFGRGVEISKSGKIVVCKYCGVAQGFKKIQLENGGKKCVACGKRIEVDAKRTMNIISKIEKDGLVRIYVGENVQRYKLDGENYILPHVTGINYKDAKMYEQPKLLIRKTGLGIYTAVDYSGSFTTQTVYILKHKRNDVPLEYYEALLNSRVVYYYYLKTYGENEWKSHPYLTKQIIFSLPIKVYFGDLLDSEIVKLAKELSQNYSHETDLELESLIMRKYGLSKAEEKMIFDEMDNLPDLGAINGMKTGVKRNV